MPVTSSHAEKIIFRSIPTFLGAPIADIEDIGQGDICLVGLFEDHADSKNFGVRFAARQIRYDSYIHGTHVQCQGEQKILDLGDLNVFPLERDRNSVALKEQFSKIFKQGGIPIVIGGSPAISNEIMYAFKNIYNDDVGIIDLSIFNKNELKQESKPLIIQIQLEAIDYMFFDRPLTTIMNRIRRIPRTKIVGAHIFGLACELDYSGRSDTSFACEIIGSLVHKISKETF